LSCIHSEMFRRSIASSTQSSSRENTYEEVRYLRYLWIYLRRSLDKPLQNFHYNCKCRSGKLLMKCCAWNVLRTWGENSNQPQKWKTDHSYLLFCWMPITIGLINQTKCQDEKNFVKGERIPAKFPLPLGKPLEFPGVPSWFAFHNNNLLASPSKENNL